MDRKGNDSFVKENQKLGYYIDQLVKIGIPEDMERVLRMDVLPLKKTVKQQESTKDEAAIFCVDVKNANVWIVNQGEWGFERITIESEIGYIDWGQGSN